MDEEVIEKVENESNDSDADKEEQTRFRYRSNIEFILISVMHCTSGEDIECLISTDASANMLMILICLMLISMPVQYMQLAIGQFTQRGSINLRHMSPIGHGTGYMMLCYAFLRCIPIALHCADMILYMLVAMVGLTPWKECDNVAYRENCWDGSQCVGECINEEKRHAAYFYYIYDHLQTPKEVSATPPDVRRLIIVMLMWVGISVMLIFSTNLTDKVMKSLYYSSLSGIALLLFVLIVSQDFIKAFEFLMAIDPNQFINNLWSEAFQEGATMMNVASGSYILLGSYLQPNMPSGTLTVLTVTVRIFVFIFINLLGQSCSLIVLKNANIFYDGRELLHNHSESYVAALTTVPAGFSFMSWGNLWSIVYYGADVILDVNYILLNCTIIEYHLIDAHKTFKRYRKYMIFSCLIAVTTLNSILTITGILAYTKHFQTFLDITSKVTLLFYTIFVCIIYGVQRLSDDIHFIFGTQPVTYWKICWYALPGIFIILPALDFIRYPASYFILAGVCSIPLVIMMGVEMFVYVRKKKIVGLVQPDELWGPPEEEQRFLRNHYNPRMETKWRRRNKNCQHKCLLHNKTLQMFLREERLSLFSQKKSDETHES